MRYLSLISVLLLSSSGVFSYAETEELHSADNVTTRRKHFHRHHHHHHHHRHHGKHHRHKVHKHQRELQKNSTKNSTRNTTTANSVSEDKIVDKMHKLEKELKAKVDKLENPKRQKIAVAPTDHTALQMGKLEVNAPLPEGFEEMFARAASEATGVNPKEVKLISTFPLAQAHGKVAVVRFKAPGDVVKALQRQAADPESKLAMGPMCAYLVARDETGSVNEQCRGGFVSALATKSAKVGKKPKSDEASEHEESNEKAAQDRGIDIDTAMPYGQLEPFGREDTAQELTESSIKESDGMVDQLERAEVAEEKRAIFRALTRLRGAAITSFDGIARSQTGNIDQYAKTNKWRETHPLRHLAQEESDISKWAFPDANL